MIHLHNHTEYSLLDGASRIEDLVLKARSFDMAALAITDHGNLYGAVEFYKACKKHQIKPIIGCELYYTPGSRFERKQERYHLVLLCKNRTGYQNLCNLVSKSYAEGFYYKPRIDWELLKQYHQGLICLSACLAGEIPRLITSGNIDLALDRCRNFKDLFGDDYYLEVMDHGLPEERHADRVMKEFGKRLDVKLVATNDTHYINKEDAHTQEILLCIGTKDLISNPNRFMFPNHEFYFKSPQEMASLFDAEIIQSTYEIADKCNFEFELGKTLLPKFPVEDSEQYLRLQVYRNIPNRLHTRNVETMKRLEYELEVINKIGFADYFLIVRDIVDWCKENKIPVGPGRGSAAGSLVSYVLGITELNPLDWGLLFERFLNPFRISMPDIDIDCCFRRRDEVVKYISSRYGQDRVAQIITFGTMAAKAAIRDVGRVFDESLTEIDRLAKRITSLTDVTDKKLQYVIDTAKQIENKPRHTGVHAAGVIIGSEPLTSIVPIQVSDGTVVTQYEMGVCEEIGLLKMDILGLKTLTVIDDALQLTKRNHIELDINSIPLDDRRVYNLLSNGHTIGVFQLESDGMQRILRRLRPDCFPDLIAMVALYRPGPLGSGMIDDFIDCKHGKKPIVYLNPALKPILQDTYGVILYQEQTMKIATDMAGFSLPEADLMRKAIGKKKPEVLAAQREKFVNGSIKNGFNKALAEEVFNLIDFFAGYGFNKSHSAAYALIAYQTAYLKTYFPLEFMCALLSNASDHDKARLLLNECRRLGIKILPPDINKSGREFTLDGKTIRFGLAAIKNLGDAAISKIISGQPFKDVYDLAARTGLNKAVLESLILSGTRSSFGPSKSLMNSLPAILQGAAMLNDPQANLFGSPDTLLTPVVNIGEYPLEELLGQEKGLLGFYVTNHPLDAFNTSGCTPINQLEEGHETIAGIITALKTGFKNNKKWAYMHIEDYSGSLEVLAFGKNIDYIVGEAYQFRGTAKREDEKFKFFVAQARRLAKVA